MSDKTTLTEHDIVHALRAPDAASLYSAARALADDVFGRQVFLRGVVEFANHCRRNCLYCGLRAANTDVERFRLNDEEILHAVSVAAAHGMGTVVLQSGEEAQGDVRRVGALVQEIKRRHNVAVTLSLGDYAEDHYRYWRDCGADRYLLKVETTDDALHARMRPGTTVTERLARVETLQRLGYETGSGVISGLPGMTPRILARDILRLSAMGLEMIAVGPFIPHPGTPLGAERAAVDIEQALRATALLRLLNPGANIPATSALDSACPPQDSGTQRAASDTRLNNQDSAHSPYGKGGREQGLAAGANVVMPSVTPERVRRNYAIYPGKNTVRCSVTEAVRQLKLRLEHAGYQPSDAIGTSLSGRFRAADSMQGCKAAQTIRAAATPSGNSSGHFADNAHTHSTTPAPCAEQHSKEPA